MSTPEDTATASNDRRESREGRRSLTPAGGARKMWPVSSEPTAGEPPAGRASVLVATSDSATRDLLRRTLNVGAVEVVDASDGLEALALARRLDLDLIVLDAFLAVMDGITVCGRIRALTEIEQPPIIIVGLISERAAEVALAAGADETLAKPLNPALIRSRTRNLLTRRQTERRVGMMRRALELSPAGVTVLDARSSEYNLAFANAAFLELSGYSSEEIAGQNLRLLMGTETDVAAMTELRDAMAAGRPARVLLRNHRKDGTPFWNDLATAPMVDASGRLTHFVAVQRDVTRIVETPEKEATRAIEETVAARTRELDAALVRVEKRRRFTETILNSMVSGILATDAAGIVTFANLAALRTLGASLADCVGSSVVELLGHNEELGEVIRGSAPQVEHRLDFPVISPGGTRFYVGVSVTRAPAELRDEVGFILLFRNLAETLTDQHDPRLAEAAAQAPAAAHPTPPPLQPEAPADRPSSDAAGPSERVGEEPAAKTAPLEWGRVLPDDATPARRVLLALRYSSPVDLVRRAIDALAAEHGATDDFIRLETAADVPEVLLDRQQLTEALVILLASTLERCGDPACVRVRVSRDQPKSGTRGGHAAAARIEILYPRALITEHDLGPEGELGGRQPYRRADLATAEKLIEANGGRLIPPAREGEEQALTVLLRAAS